MSEGVPVVLKDGRTFLHHVSIHEDLYGCGACEIISLHSEIARLREALEDSRRTLVNCQELLIEVVNDKNCLDGWNAKPLLADVERVIKLSEALNPVEMKEE